MDSKTNTNKHGFPIQTCTRCGGSGHYSYNQIDGTRCYGCGGSGMVIVKKAKAAWNAYVAAVRAQRETTWANIAVGDIVRVPNNGSKGEYVEVLAIETTDRLCGWTVTNGIRTDFYTLEITYRTGDDTMTESVHYNQIAYRKPMAIDPAPFLATIGKTK